MHLARENEHARVPVSRKRLGKLELRMEERAQEIERWRKEGAQLRRRSPVDENPEFLRA